jgi:hypothetical protein
MPGPFSQRKYNQISEVKERKKLYRAQPYVRERDRIRHSAYYWCPTIRERAAARRKNCRVILQKHHDDMVWDPEHLTTEFIAKMARCRCKKGKD